MDNDMERLSLYKKIAASLEQLEMNHEQPACDEAASQSAATNEPDFLYALFIIEPEKVTKYCRALTQVLINGETEPETEVTLIDLLFDLVGYQVELLKASRHKTTHGEIIRF